MGDHGRRDVSDGDQGIFAGGIAVNIDDGQDHSIGSHMGTVEVAWGNGHGLDATGIGRTVIDVGPRDTGEARIIQIDGDIPSDHGGRAVVRHGDHGIGRSGVAMPVGDGERDAVQSDVATREGIGRDVHAGDTAVIGRTSVDVGCAMVALPEASS